MKTLDHLKEMYEQWPFFREMVDLIAMTLSKTVRSLLIRFSVRDYSPADVGLLDIFQLRAAACRRERSEPVRAG